MAEAEFASELGAEEGAAAEAGGSGSGVGSGVLATSTALLSHAQPLWTSIKTALAESENPYLTVGGLICATFSVVNAVAGELWILQPLMRATANALLDSAEEKANNGSSSSSGSMFSLGLSSSKGDKAQPATAVSARRSVILLERNARTIRVAYHCFGALLGGIGGALIVLGRPPGQGSTRDANKERDLLKVLTGTFTTCAIIVTFLGTGHGSTFKAPAFPTLGPLAVLMALGLARFDRKAHAVTD
ncbi:hypothetical protein DFJ74DRAFT_662226 [Hyaloraphidium curvatum]|nr:hypothetical protein DFJ74DRAFT_662226 [Hyaloraphidium curvatum]